jgi:hypothetical protein
MSLFLIGSPTPPLLKLVGERAAAASKKGKPRVAVSMTTMLDHPHGAGFLSRTMEAMFPHATVERFTVHGEPDAMPKADAHAIVQRADIVFLPGGDPVAGAKLLVAAGADEWLRGARARGAVMVGISAGSIALGAWWGDWPADGDDDAAPELVPCTNVADGFVFDAHAEEDDWIELRIVARHLHRKHPKLRYVGLPTGAAIELDAAGKLHPIGVEPFVLSEP